MKEPLRVQTLQEYFEIAQDHVVELRRTLEPVIQVDSCSQKMKIFRPPFTAATPSGTNKSVDRLSRLACLLVLQLLTAV
jgi:hypothetical protein